MPVTFDESSRKLAFFEAAFDLSTLSHDVRFRLVEKHRSCFPVSLACRWLKVSRNGYYVWRRRSPTSRQQSDARLMDMLGGVDVRTRGTYGVRRLRVELLRAGLRVGGKRLARILREHRRPPEGPTGPGVAAAPANLLDRRFAAAAPNEVWMADVTYVWTEEGWLYVAAVMDLFSRRVVGWATSARVDRRLCLDALSRAVDARQPKPGLLHHSDRGSQYNSRDYRSRLETLGMTCSMSRKGTCLDNAVIESFWRTLKREVVHRSRFATRTAAVTAVREYIDDFYNPRRLHSSLGYRSPVEFESAYYSSAARQETVT